MRTSKTAQRAKQTFVPSLQQRQIRRLFGVCWLVSGWLVSESVLAQSPTDSAPATVIAASETAPASVVADSSELTDVSDKDFFARSRPLFDGKSLTGWEGTAYWFRVEDESVVAGRLEKEIPKNQFLCTVGKVS